jgi:hypothetical protein
LIPSAFAVFWLMVSSKRVACSMLSVDLNTGHRSVQQALFSTSVGRHRELSSRREQTITGPTSSGLDVTEQTASDHMVHIPFKVRFQAISGSATDRPVLAVYYQSSTNLQ